uniref:Uncharacterized protein n=1 Tax=viral metagenome TaxID=1070528 RepID=A0A6C0B9C5_9ZZZZ
MTHFMLLFTLLFVCRAFFQFHLLNKVARKIQLSKNIIPVFKSEKRIIYPNFNEPTWEEGEIPWDFRPDNKTNVKKIGPKKPIYPSDSLKRIDHMFAVVLE